MLESGHDQIMQAARGGKQNIAEGCRNLFGAIVGPGEYVFLIGRRGG